uniref:Uncharacterized protein n=1 Tax=Desulfovibrio sp. U5L TaxID=596152 RepID=I2Q2P0_9BACT
MTSRLVFGAACLLLAVVLAALAVQSIRAAGLETQIAVLARELAAANTRAAELEASEATLLAVRDGLAGQVEACQQANTQERTRTVTRVEIIRNAKPVPAQAGKVVDDATSRRAAVHLNDACR